MRKFIILGLVFAAFLAAASTTVLTQTSETREQGFVEGLVQRLLSSEGRTLKVSSLGIGLSGNVTVGRIEVHDEDGAWLTVDDAALDWQPFSLLGSTLRINELKAGNISVNRLPRQLPDAEAPQEASNLGGVVVERLNIDELDIDRAAFGHAMKVAAVGSLQITQDPRVVTIKLSARQRDEIDGRFNADIAYEAATEELAVDVVLTEGRGGLVSTFLPLAKDNEVALRIAGTGRLDAWTGDIGFTVADETVVGGTARIRGESDQYALGLDLAGAFDKLTPEGLDTVFAGRTTLSLALRYSAERPLLIDRAELKSDTVSVTANGTVDTEGEETSVVVEARTLGTEPLTVGIEGAPVGSVTLAAAAIKAQVKGALERPQWSLDAMAQSIAAANVTVRNPHIEANGTGLALSGARAVELDLAISGTISPDNADALPPLLAGAVSARFGFSVTENALAVTRGEIESDRYRLAASGRYGLKDAGFALDVDFDASSPQTGNPTIDRLLQGPVRLSGKVQGRSLDTVTFENVSFSSSVVEATINGQYDSDGQTKLAAEAIVAELAKLHPAAEGRIDLLARLEGPFDALKVEFTGRGQRVAIAGRALDDLQLEVSGTIDETVPELAIALDTTLADQPIGLTARLSGGEGGALHLRDIDGRFGPAALSGALALTAAGTPEGAVMLTVADLAELADPALQGLAGSLEARMAFASENGKSVANIRLKGLDLAREDMRIGLVSARFKIDDLLGTLGVSGSGVIEAARFGGSDVGGLAFDLETAPENPYRLTLRDQGGRWSASSTFELEFPETATVVRLRALKGSFDGTSLKLAQPTALRINQNAVVLERTEIVAGGGSIVVSGALSPELSLRAEIDRLPLAIAAVMVPEAGLQGSISGTVVASGRLAAPHADIRLTGRDISISQLRSRGVAPVSFDATGTLRDQIMTLRVNVRESDVALALSGTVNLAGSGRVDLAVTGALPSSFLTRLGAENDLIIRSTARVDLRLSGPLRNIAYSGAITTSGATFGDAAGRFTVRNVSARVVFDGQSARIEQFTGTTAGGSGRVRISGTIGLSNGVPTNIGINIDKGRYTDGTLLVTLFDARLNLRGGLGGSLTLAGNIDLFKPTITLNEPLPSSLEPLSVIHRSPPPEVRRQQILLRKKKAAGGAAGGFEIDIEVRTADQILVTGRGVNAELGGTLRLTGPISQPRAFGAFRLRRGNVKLLSRKIEFTKGELNFTGYLSPQILFIGTARTETANITLTISGQADTPSVTVSSSPDLPQEEALALLIFGRSIAELSPLQVAQMAGSIALLSGGSGGGLFDGLKDVLGSTNIELVRTEKGGTAVSVGRQINDRLGVGVQQDTGTGTRRVQIDLEVMRGLKLRGSVGDDRSTKAGIFYEKEY